MFKAVDQLRDMFGPRPGSDLATRTTYIPTGKIERIQGWNNMTFMSIDGCRTFPVEDFDWMVNDWMPRYAPKDLLALQIVERDLLR